MRLNKRNLSLLGVAMLGMVHLHSNPGLPSQIELETLGVYNVPTGSTINGITIRDLSGIAYDRERGVFLAVNDSSGSGQAGIYELDIQYDATGIQQVTPLRFQRLGNEGGATLPNIDAEGLALGQNGDLYVSTEGRGTANPPESRDPVIWQFDSTNLYRTAILPIPEKFLPFDNAGNPVAPGSENQHTGVQLNLGFEALSLSPAEKSLFAANEAALFQDDNRAPFDGQFNQAHESSSRIVRFHRNEDGLWVAGQEKVYQADQGTLFFIIRIFNTVPSLLAIDDTGRLLVMERGLTTNNLNTGSYRIRIYEVNFNQPNTTDVSTYPSLLDLPSPLVFNRLSKRRVWENTSGMDNVEGMTWGRDINGYRTLILVSDNNSSASQTNQFIAIQTNIPAPVEFISSTTGPGSVSFEPPLQYHLPGTVIRVEATPDSGYAFIKWEGSEGDNQPEVFLDAIPGQDIHATARFGTYFQLWLRNYYSEQEIADGGLENPLISSLDDGIPNLHKYAFGLPPDQWVRQTPVISSVNTVPEPFLFLEFTRPEPAPEGISYALQFGDDLSHWTSYSLEGYPFTDNEQLDGESIRIRISGPLSLVDQPKQFLRLAVEEDPPSVSPK